jgi:hypothetical protein
MREFAGVMKWLNNEIPNSKHQSLGFGCQVSAKRKIEAET